MNTIQVCKAVHLVVAAAIAVMAAVTAGAVDTAVFSPREKPVGAPVLAATTDTQKIREMIQDYRWLLSVREVNCHLWL